MHSICNIKYSVPKRVGLVFHKGSNYDYHFIIKELARVFKKQFNGLGKNTEKYVTFTIPVEKEVTRIDENRTEITKIICYILKIIDSAGFMASSLTNLVNNHCGVIHRIKCKLVLDDKKCITCGIKYTYCDCFLEYRSFKDDLI